MSKEFGNSFFRFEDRSDLTFIISEEKNYSYFELFSEAKSLAEKLALNRVKKHDYVPLVIEDNLEFIRTVIALWYLNAIPVPINTRLLNSEIYALTSDNGFQLIITDKPELKSTYKDYSLILSTDLRIDLKDSFSFKIPKIDEEALVIFTSGSSGKPKGVVHTFSSLMNSIQNGRSVLKQESSSRWLASLPLYHISGFQILCRSLFYGSSVILTEKPQFETLRSAIEIFKPTHLSLVSSQIKKIVETKMKPPKEITLTLAGGGVISDYLIEQMYLLGWNPVRVYGSSETASFITAANAEDIFNKAGTAGRPIKNVKILIDNSGEILVSTNSLFKKYLNDEKQTLIRIKDGFYHSGDIGRLDEDGFLFIESRNDLIVTGGENVNPIEIESQILKLEGVKEVCVFSKDDETWGQIVCAAIVTDIKLDEQEIQNQLRKVIADFKVPKKYFFVDSLPKTQLGKILREKVKSFL
jgi:O-succinylbenzoic acid--CoA ligase